MRDLPGVSCLCTTYGRPPDYLHLVEEAIESFLRQDYEGPKELLVANDAPAQTLLLDREYPGVRLLNLPERFPAVGAKMNFLCEQAQYPLLAPWDDDDLSLPGRLRQGVERIGEAPYWNPERCWHLNFNDLIDPPSSGACHTFSIFRKDAWRKVGGYPADECNSYDRALDGKLKALGGIPPGFEDNPLHVRQAIYCWAGRSPTHVSGYDYPNRAYYEQIAQRGKIAGFFTITPRWHRDYLAMVAAKLKEYGR